MIKAKEKLHKFKTDRFLSLSVFLFLMRIIMAQIRNQILSIKLRGQMPQIWQHSCINRYLPLLSKRTPHERTL